ncbi:MAG: hypothetical protein IKK63_06085 [Clostridia bacterium]|nr:hypothetical protein [Clostridia bacterium]
MNKKRISVLLNVCLVLLGVWVCYCTWSFAYIKGLNPKADEIKIEILEDDVIRNTYEGSILDSKGNIISYAVKKGTNGGVIDHECYQRLVGFSSAAYGRSGLRSLYRDELWTPDKKTSKGATIRLTTNSDIQSIAYEEINSYTEGESCAIVLENKTGKVIALASANAAYNLDYNNLTEDSVKKANSIEGFFLNPWQAKHAPGSVIKAVTGIAIAEKGYSEEVYYDSGVETVDGHDFHNFGNYNYENVALVGGMQNSVNTYFAHMGMKVGSYILRDVHERLLIGKTLELDFGTISSEHNLDKDISKTNIAASAFGQGKLLITPMNIAMIAQSIANDGIMLKPYIVESIITDSGKVLQEGKKEAVSEVSDKKTISVIKNALLETGIHYKINSKRKIGAKTGSAQLGNGLNRATFMSFNEDYTVVICVNNTSKRGSALKESALRIFDALEKIK